MKKINYCCILLLLAIWASSCAVSSERKSAAYYNKNKLAINQLRFYFDTLYSQQPFSAGFTYRSFKYYVMEVTTDTLRYIYNTEQSEAKLFETIKKFNYDADILRKMATKMKEIKCLWLDKSSFYIDNKKETVTFFSFKSVLVEKPFTENKYYTLIFLDKPIEHPAIKARVTKGELVRINDLVYFTIANHFR